MGRRIMIKSSYLYKNRSPSSPSHAEVQPDCRRLTVHEMPHAMSFKDITHWLASQPLHLLGSAGRVLDVSGLVKRVFDLLERVFTTTLDDP